MSERAETVEEMEELGRKAAAGAGSGTLIALVGGLGAGKTHWTKGFVAGMGSPAEVTSPTFGLMHEYPGGRLPVFHLDFYRLDSEDELLALGWDEVLEAGGVVIAEWADKFPQMLPEDAIWKVFSIDENGGRRLEEGRF